MGEFLQLAVSFPTVVFTLALAVVCAYWAFTLLGALDVDMLDGLAGDGDLDLDVDVDVDGPELDADADIDADGAAGSPAGLWSTFVSLTRLGRVPVTVTLSLFALGGWVCVFLLDYAYLRATGELGPPLLLALGGLLAASAGGVALANVGSRPLEPVFRTPLARTNASLTGEVCEIDTGRVTESFGQALLTVGSDHLTVQVRCDTPRNGLGRGSPALIVHFDQQRNAFVVEPLTTDSAALGQPEPPTARARPLSDRRTE